MNLFMVRLCGLADEINRSRAVSSAEAEFFSILLVPIVKGTGPSGAGEKGVNRLTTKQGVLP